MKPSKGKPDHKDTFPQRGEGQAATRVGNNNHLADSYRTKELKSRRRFPALIQW